MDVNALPKRESLKKAISLGTLCSVSYLAVYFARNVLGAVTPQMIEHGYTEAFLGSLSSAYFAFYAIGQLINGIIGDKIKAKYMMSIGLFMAGVTNLIFLEISDTSKLPALIVYGMMGFFLSMIYAPMTKIVSENVEPLYATRCSLGYSLAAFLGSPLAGFSAALMVWHNLFRLSSFCLGTMAVVFFVICSVMEKKGMVKYGQYKPKAARGGNIKVLIKRNIIKFALVAIVTGTVRTSVVFWLPTYISQHLGFPSDTAVMIFAIATFAISATPFISVFIYERLKRNMHLTMFIMFISAALSFVAAFLINEPIFNIIFMILAIISSNGADTMMWSRYCPSLYDTGMVSTATGFLDFISYASAAAANLIFANAVSAIGWGKLILVWCAMMVFGIIVSIPKKANKKDAV